jgi:predicted transglutaminase-like cysteine proteinase
MSWINNLARAFCGHGPEINALEESRKDFENKYLTAKKVYGDLLTDYTKLSGDFIDCGDAVKALELENFELKNMIKPTPVPNAEITYTRPILIGTNKFGQKEIDVRLFIQPDFEIEKTINSKKLMYDGEQDLDKLIPKVYAAAKASYKYGSDSNYGFSEYWMFPFELRYVRSKNLAGDCDDWSNWIASHFAAANIPRHLWLVSCGTTRNGFGHSTIYCKDSEKNWHHLNSTKPDYRYDDLKKYPSNKDETDKIGIKDGGFWFSYNDAWSIHKFESTEAAATSKKEKLKIKIKRK